MVREVHYSGSDQSCADDYRPQPSGAITSVTSRVAVVAFIGHDDMDWFHRLDDAGHGLCGARRDTLTRCPYIPRAMFATTSDVKWCPMCKRAMGMK